MSTFGLTCRFKRFAIAALTLAAVALASPQVNAQARAFQKVFNGNLPGQLVVVGNSIVTCDRTRSSAADCNSVEMGAGPPTLSNDDVTTAFIDIDGDDATFNSSAATLTVNGQIEWAGLYWWGSTDADKATRVVDVAGRGKVLFKSPAGAYVSVTSSWLVDGDPYLAYSDVTALVKAGGAGSYQVANLVTFGGSDDHLGGWSLVVVNRDDALPFRHISIYDGYQTYGGGNAVNVQFQDFLTPLIGPVSAQATFIALDGDAGKGDEVTFNGTPLVGPLNPLGDFGNSTITSGGLSVTARTPAFPNTLGTDIDTFDVSSVVANGATSAIATFSGVSSETNFAVLMGFQTTLYSPIIKADKSVVDINGGETRPGDVLQYSVAVKNDPTAQDGAVEVVLTDLIPADSTYVAGSLQVTVTTANAAPLGLLTDAAGDDAGEYDDTKKQITVRLGALATAALGGTLAPSAAMTIAFQVKVSADLLKDSILSNQAKVTFKGLTLAMTAGSAVITVTSNSPVTGGPTTTPVTPIDTDKDGLSDKLEMLIGTDPMDADSDDDGVVDGSEPSFDVDTDGDGLINALDADSDNDGIFDGTELGLDCSNPATNLLAKSCIADADPATKTNPLDRDTDKGTKPDGAEDANHNGKVDVGETDPNNPADDTTNKDTDGDGLSDDEETQIGSNPNDADSDDDGLLDGQETNPSADTDGDGLINVLDPDSDNDGLFDGTEAGKDCSNAATNVTANRCVPDADLGATKTSPVKKDTDNGGKSDGAEDGNLNGRIDAAETDPNNPADDNAVVDTDKDGLSDKEEMQLGSDPNDADSDDDGLLDGLEANPADDTDADGKKNVLDPDSDGDGIFDGTEAGKDCSNPATDVTKASCVADADPATTTSGVKLDTDRGGIPDGVEDKNHNGQIDVGDGDPNNPADDKALIADNDKDKDKDGLSDDDEVLLGSDPNDADSDDDGVLDGDEVAPGADPDGDGIKNVLDSDSDNDGLFDGTELGKDCSNPATDVSKGFCIADADAGATKTDPQSADTDRGSVPDGREDANHNGRIDVGETDPNNPADDVPGNVTPPERIGIIAGGGLDCSFGPGADAPGLPLAILGMFAFGLVLRSRRRR